MLPCPFHSIALALAASTQIPSGPTLEAPTPDWYTPEVHSRVLEAGLQGLAFDLGTESAVRIPSRVQPGMKMLSPVQCTVNFLFVDIVGVDDDGEQYIGTAGHCVAVGSDVVVEMLPLLAVWVGTTRLSLAGGIGNDYALIRIQNPGLVADPSTLLIGGPQCGALPPPGPKLTPCKFIGNGTGHGAWPCPREGVLQMHQPSALFFGLGSPGDSGSPVLEQTGGAGCPHGRAAAILTHGVAGTDWFPFHVQLAGTWVANIPATLVNQE